jgi:xanthine dehydrogenase YagT iron-sulfur-binding subunit
MNDTQERNKNGPGLSRRDFLRGSGVAAATAAAIGAPVALPVAEAAPTDEKTVAVGPGPAKITLDVNGVKMTSQLEPRVTLLDALRNYLDVTGCKRVCDRGTCGACTVLLDGKPVYSCSMLCDRGTCGACTVLLDGKPVYSCSMLAIEAQGATIKTAEALIDGEKLDAVPAAFAAHDAQQCGFCTPGFVVAMKAVFEKNPKATPAEVEEGLSGNICRCGTYEQMRHAIEALCQQKKGG